MTNISSIALGVVWIFQSSRRSLYSSVAIDFGTAYYMSSLGVNILVTILITTRLVLHRREIVDILPPEHAACYLSMTSIIIESAALYSVTALVFIISYALDNPINQIFLSLASACQVCASIYDSWAWHLAFMMNIANCRLSHYPTAGPRTRLESDDAQRDCDIQAPTHNGTTRRIHFQ